MNNYKNLWGIFTLAMTGILISLGAVALVIFHPFNHHRASAAYSDPSSTSSASLTLPPSPTPTGFEHLSYHLDDLDPALQTQIESAIVRPLVDYYTDIHADPDYVKSITISKYTGWDPIAYPFNAIAVFKTGASETFPISRIGGQINYWLPKCGSKCEFSEAFKQRYPQIIKQVGEQKLP